MLTIIIMDEDIYIKYGLSLHFKRRDVKIIAVSNIEELTFRLQNMTVDVVMMELFNQKNSVPECLDFIRYFGKTWQRSKLIIYTELARVQVFGLLISTTGQKLVFKNDNLNALTSSIFSAKESATSKDAQDVSPA